MRISRGTTNLSSVGSMICAISGSFTMMMTGRVIQAVGAGILMPVGMNIFMTIFPPHKRGAAMGLLGIAMILGPAIGPTITGWVIQNYTWNVIFYAMFIIGLLIIVLALKYFTLKQPVTKATLDTFGVVASSIGLGSLLYGFSEAGNKGWSSAEVIITMVIGIIGISLFVWRQLTTANETYFSWNSNAKYIKTSCGLHWNCAFNHNYDATNDKSYGRLCKCNYNNESNYRKQTIANGYNDRISAGRKRIRLTNAIWASFEVIRY